MAIKGDRHELQTDLSYICNDVVVKGNVLCYKTGGSGSALDDAAAVVTLVTGSPSGTNKVAGMTLSNTVNIDTTRQHINFMKDELVIGSHITLLRQGWVTTDQILVGTSPAVGDPVYLGFSGLLTNTAGAGVNIPVKGEWMGVKDPDGFCKVAIHLP